MAKKNVYFYALSLFDSNTNKELKHTKVNGLFEEIFKTNVKNKALVLEEGEKRVTMDILFNDISYLFGKVGRVKENSTLQYREFKTLENYDVLNPMEKHSKGVEIFTYFLFDYKHAILSIISGQSAPGAKIINNIIGNYNDEYYTEINPISDPQSVKSLFKEGSTLFDVTYTVSVPDSKVLGELIGLDRNQITMLRRSNSREVEITIRNKPRKLLTDSLDTIKELITSFQSKRTDYVKVSFMGKSQNSQTQEYPLDEKMFTYSVDIPTYQIEDYKPVYFDRKVIDTFYQNNIKMAYNESKGDLLLLSNRLNK